MFALILMVPTFLLIIFVSIRLTRSIRLLTKKVEQISENELLESYICRYKYAKSSYADIAWREFEKEDPDLEV